MLRAAAIIGLLALCIVSSAFAQGYPETGITKLRATCAQRNGLTAQERVIYCDCYVDLMQKTIPWHDFMSLDAAISTKGVSGLDKEETALFAKGMKVTFYCSQKAAR